MGKRTILFFSILLLTGILFFPVKSFLTEETPEYFPSGGLAGEVRQAKQILEQLPDSLNPEDIRLCFKGEELACDKDTKVWYLPVDMEQPHWEKGTFSVFGGELQAAPLTDYTVLDKQTVVAEGEPIPFLIWKESACAQISVVFTGLPVVRIETDADLAIDTVFAGSVVFYENCGKDGWITSSVFEAHERGQTTRAFPKKGYRLNLISVTGTGVVKENPKPVFGMRNSDSWIFYAIYSDGTKVRDKFNIELWNAFGAADTPYEAHYGTHMEYAELVVNGEYRGLYGILEPIDCRQLKISDQEYLYKRTVGRELSTELLDTARPEEYLTVLGMEIKGKEACGNREDWQSFRRFVAITEAEDEEFAEETAKLLNMDNAADIWLYLQMIYGEDNIYKNMFFAFKREAAGERLYLVPWDVDLTWGNVYTDQKEELYTIKAPERAGQYLSWPFMDRVLRLNAGGLQTVVKERYEVLREGVLSDGQMQELLDGCIRQVQDSGAFARDAQRWPDSHHDGDYEGLRDFMEERMNYLDKNMGNMDEWLQS